MEYVVEEEPLGTGGAIRKAMGQVAGPSAFVFNGDTWLDVDYGAMNDFAAGGRGQASQLPSRTFPMWLALGEWG